MNIEYKQYDAKVVFVPYVENGNTAMQIIDRHTNESITMATVNLGFRLPPHMVLIKSWSENDGIVDELVKAGVIKPKVFGEYPSGFVTVRAYELTETAETERQKQYQENEYASILC